MAEIHFTSPLLERHIDEQTKEIVMSESPASPSNSFVGRSSSSRESLTKNLRFDLVTIKDMPIKLGEHPASDGAPITIGWIAESTRYVHIDVYELFKDDIKKTESDLRLSATDRAKILLRAGYDIEDIVIACEQAQELLKQRESSSRNQRWEMLYEVKERAGRSIKKFARNPAA